MSNGDLALLAAVERIKNPPTIQTKTNQQVKTKYEHHVATWATTKLCQTFPLTEDWCITPEQRDPNTKKKPDLIVEKAIRVGSKIDLRIHLCMELKKEGGDRIEDALAQLCDSIQETIDIKGNLYGSEFEVFAVVQYGLNIGFFEYHADQSNLDEEWIPHFRGCVSLTHTYPIGGIPQVVMDEKDIPNDLEKLYFNFNKLRKTTEVREDAKSYPIPCIFHIEKHKKQVDALFKHMAKSQPRSSW
jgi:hypothetical protein